MNQNRNSTENQVPLEKWIRQKSGLDLDTRRNVIKNGVPVTLLSLDGPMACAT